MGIASLTTLKVASVLSLLPDRCDGGLNSPRNARPLPETINHAQARPSPLAPNSGRMKSCRRLARRIVTYLPGSAASTQGSHLCVRSYERLHRRARFDNGLAPEDSTGGWRT